MNMYWISFEYVLMHMHYFFFKNNLRMTNYTVMEVRHRPFLFLQCVCCHCGVFTYQSTSVLITLRHFRLTLLSITHILSSFCLFVMIDAVWVSSLLTSFIWHLVSKLLFSSLLFSSLLSSLLSLLFSSLLFSSLLFSSLSSLLFLSSSLPLLFSSLLFCSLCFSSLLV